MVPDEVIETFAKDNNMTVEEAGSFLQNLGISPPRLFDLKLGEQSPAALRDQGLADLPYEERQRRLSEIGEGSFVEGSRPASVLDRTQGEELLEQRSKLERSFDSPRARIISGYTDNGYGQLKPIINYDYIAEMAGLAAGRNTEGILLPVMRYNLPNDIHGARQFRALQAFSQSSAGEVGGITRTPKTSNLETGSQQFTRYADVEVDDITYVTPAHGRYDAAEFTPEDFGFPGSGRAGTDELGNVPGVDPMVPKMTPQEAADYQMQTASHDPRARDELHSLAETDEAAFTQEIQDGFNQQLDEISNLDNYVDDLSQMNDYDPAMSKMDVEKIADEITLPEGVASYSGAAGINIQPESFKKYAWDQLSNLTKVQREKYGFGVIEQSHFDSLSEVDILSLLYKADIPLAPIFRAGEAPAEMITGEVLASAVRRLEDVDPSGQMRFIEHDINTQTLTGEVDNLVTSYSELPWNKRLAVDEMNGLEDPEIYRVLESPPGDLVTFIGPRGAEISLEVHEIKAKGGKFLLKLKNTPYNPSPETRLLDLAGVDDGQAIISYARSIGVPGVPKNLKRFPEGFKNLKKSLIEKIQAFEQLAATGKSLKGSRYAFQNTQEHLTAAAKDWGGLAKMHNQAAAGDRYPIQAIMQMEVAAAHGSQRTPLTQVMSLDAYSHLRDPKHQMDALNQFTTRELEAIEKSILSSYARPRRWKYNDEFNQITEKQYSSMWDWKGTVPGAPGPGVVPASVPPALAALLQRRRVMSHALNMSDEFKSIPEEAKESLIRSTMGIPARNKEADMVEQIKKRVLIPDVIKNLGIKPSSRYSTKKSRDYAHSTATLSGITTSPGSAFEHSVTEPSNALAEILAKARLRADEIHPSSFESGGFFYKGPTNTIGQPGGAGVKQLDKYEASNPSTSEHTISLRGGRKGDGKKKGSQAEEVRGSTNVTPSKTVAFTGHRPKDLDLPSGKLEGGLPEEVGSSIPRLEPDDPKVNAIKEALRSKIREQIGLEKDTFVSGMAEGVDTWAAEEVLALKKEFPNIRLIAAVPFEGQEKLWSKISQKRYHGLLDRADGVVIVGKNERGASVPALFNQRNEFMKNISSDVIAVYGGKRLGGTYNMVKSLKASRKIIIDPNRVYQPPKSPGVGIIGELPPGSQPPKLEHSGPLSGRRASKIHQSRQPFGPETQDEFNEALRKLMEGNQ